MNNHSKTYVVRWDPPSAIVSVALLRMSVRPPSVEGVLLVCRHLQPGLGVHGIGAAGTTRQKHLPGNIEEINIYLIVGFKDVYHKKFHIFNLLKNLPNQNSNTRQNYLSMPSQQLFSLNVHLFASSLSLIEEIESILPSAVDASALKEGISLREALRW